MSKFRRAVARRRERIRLFVWLEMANFRRAIYRPGTKVNDNLENICRDFIDAELADHPELRQAVTPSYPFPGKRPIFNQTFYAALKADNVTLIPRAVTEVTPKGIVDTEGTEHQVDVIVMATGFQPTNYLASFEIIGRHGRSLHATWAGEPEAFLGMTVPGFPNFYMLYGPNTNGGEIIFFLEHQSAYAVRAMKRMMRRAGDRHRGAPRRLPDLQPLDAAQHAGYVLADDQQLLQGGRRQGGHAVATRGPVLRLLDQCPGPDLLHGPPGRASRPGGHRLPGHGGAGSSLTGAGGIGVERLRGQGGASTGQVSHRHAVPQGSPRSAVAGTETAGGGIAGCVEARYEGAVNVAHTTMPIGQEASRTADRSGYTVRA